MKGDRKKMFDFIEEELVNIFWEIKARLAKVNIALSDWD
jgi:hypothetical protein